MRIAWFSNSPFNSSGYGVQTKLFLPRLQALGHDMACIGQWGVEGGIITWAGSKDGPGIPIFPKGLHKYSMDVISSHSQKWNADIMISLFDSWIFQPEPEARMGFEKIRWVPWFPVDMEPIPPIVVKKVSQSYQGIVYSKFARREAARAGLDVRYVPHAVDTQVYAPSGRTAAREYLKVPNDLYIVGIVAANTGYPSRKALEPSIRAFAEFHKRHPNSLLYLHTVMDERNQGINLNELLEVLGLAPGHDVLFCDQYQNSIGYPDAHMANIYNALDVLLAVSTGEGFGVPILEAQACGTPVIVGDWTAMSELCWYGEMVDKSDAEPLYMPLASYQFVPRAAAIVDALERAYRKHNMQHRPAQVAEYDADAVTEKYWWPVLDELAERVGAEKATAAVPVAHPNGAEKVPA